MWHSNWLLVKPRFQRPPKDVVYEKKMDMGFLDKQDSVLFHFSANYYIS